MNTKSYAEFQQFQAELAGAMIFFDLFHTVSGNESFQRICDAEFLIISELNRRLDAGEDMESI